MRLWESELDPLNPFFAGMHGWHLAWLGRYDDAVSEFRRALSVVPNYPQPRWGLMIIAACQGRDDEALAHMQALFAGMADREAEQAVLAGPSGEVSRGPWQASPIVTRDERARAT